MSKKIPPCTPVGEAWRCGDIYCATGPGRTESPARFDPPGSLDETPTPGSGEGSALHNFRLGSALPGPLLLWITLLNLGQNPVDNHRFCTFQYILVCFSTK